MTIQSFKAANVRARNIADDETGENAGVELYAWQSYVAVEILGTHEEIRQLARKLIELADQTRANEWRRRAAEAEARKANS